MNSEEKVTLLNAPPIYKPFHYEWAHKNWRTQQELHWLATEVPMSDDVKDWGNKLNDKERSLLTHIFRFFTQAEIEVNNCYMKNYLQIFKPNEVCMMLIAFSNIETVHTDAYSYLLDTIGMPEVEYQAFRKYKEMKDKYEFMQQFNMNSKMDIALTLAAFGAFMEGLQLFASFVILLNFQRFGKMKGMCQIVAWAARDETLHCLSIIKLFHTFVEENKHELGEINIFKNPIKYLIQKLLINPVKYLWKICKKSKFPWQRDPLDDLHEKVYEICRETVRHEDAFIDLAFELGDVEGLSKDQVKQYIRFIANRRLQQLKMNKIYDIEENPLPWVDFILNGVEHVNFFENKVTEYAKSATQGTWEEVFKNNS